MGRPLVSRTVFGWAVLAWAVLPALARAAEGNLLANGDFAAGLSGWTPYGDAAAFAVEKGPGAEGTAVAYRCNPAKSRQPVHLDQTVALEPGAMYSIAFRAYNDGTNLHPALRVAGMDWQTIVSCEVTAQRAWQDVSSLFVAGDAAEVRVQLFGAGRDNHAADKAGRAWFAAIRLRKVSDEEVRRFYSARIQVRPAEQQIAVSPLFFGVNALFWIENDAARADGKIAGLLKDMRCALIRFPGGEVADNYHWQTNRLDNIQDFPYSDGPPTMDLNEFWEWKTAIGAEAIFVVNLESGYLHGDPDAGIAEAVAWVKDCAAKGRRVKYWEIGNETYLAGTRYPLTAREYAAALVKYSRALKAADPSIQIGAVGPESATSAALLDTLEPKQIEELLSTNKDWRKRALKSAKDLPRRADADLWWPTLCRAAQGAFDFAVVHRYDFSRQAFDHYAAAPLRLKDATCRLREYFRATLGHEIPLALTEWNVNRNAKLSPLEHALTIGEQIGNYLEGGMTMGNYWPMRYDTKSAEAGFRMLIDYQTNEPRAAYYVMKEFSLYGRGAVVASDCSQPMLYTVATRDGNAVTLFAINRSFRPEGIEAAIDLPGASAVEARSLVGDETTPAGARMTPLTVTGKGRGGFECRLPPGSFSVLRFNLAPSR